MTWEEWVNSSYNTINGRINDNIIIIHAMSIICKTTYEYVNSTDIINETRYLTVQYSSGGSSN